MSHFDKKGFQSYFVKNFFLEHILAIKGILSIFNKISHILHMCKISKGDTVHFLSLTQNRWAYSPSSHTINSIICAFTFRDFSCSVFRSNTQKMVRVVSGFPDSGRVIDMQVSIAWNTLCWFFCFNFSYCQLLYVFWHMKPMKF